MTYISKKTMVVKNGRGDIVQSFDVADVDMKFDRDPDTAFAPGGVISSIGYDEGTLTLTATLTDDGAFTRLIGGALDIGIICPTSEPPPGSLMSLLQGWTPDTLRLTAIVVIEAGHCGDLSYRCYEREVGFRTVVSRGVQHYCSFEPEVPLEHVAHCLMALTGGLD